jgi:UDP-glucose 4-epimerase
VEVRDIERAYLLATDSVVELPSPINIGTGGEYSVLERINVITQELDIRVIPITSDRGSGAPSKPCVDVSLASTMINSLTNLSGVLSFTRISKTHGFSTSDQIQIISTKETQVPLKPIRF